MNEIPSFEDLIELFLAACSEGQAPEIKDFAARYPAYESRLREILPLLVEMEALGKSRRGNIPETVPFPDMPGDEFRLLEKIGDGGMGTVFKALQIPLNRYVAVKLLSPSLITDAQQRGLFEQEARVIAMLHHPNIVKVFNAGSRRDYCYYAMELIDGRGLDSYHFKDVREIALIGVQAAKALAYAHSCNVMHRDIKPANLLLDSEHTVHVSDFGLAFILKNRNELVKNVETQSGTLRYMAPERLSQGITSFLSDQYSLGATLYELAAQTPLFPEQNPKALRERICREPVPPLPRADPDFAAILGKSLSFNPADRYENMEAFAEDLQRFLNHEPVSARPVSAFRRLVLWMKRKPALAALSFASVFFALALLAALIIGYWRTASALKRAEQNAAVADMTLSGIFSYVENQPPSVTGTELLSALMPYYQRIAAQRQLSGERIAQANNIIGTAALRAGNSSLAETAFRRLAELRPDAYPLNQLSEALREQGKNREADEISRQVISRFADSEKAGDRFEAVRAFKALAAEPDGEELRRAFQISKSLLRTNPENPEYRFQFATILGNNPGRFHPARIAGVEPNAVVLLKELTETSPDRPEYGLALVDLMRRRLRYARNFEQRDWNELAAVLSLSDRLLGRWPSDPKVISAVTRLRETHADVLRRNGDRTGARRENERLLGFMEILFHHPDTPDPAKEGLIRLQLQRLERAVRDGRRKEARRLSADISAELTLYHGSKQAEFKTRLTELESGRMNDGEE